MNAICTITLNGQVVELYFGLPANRAFYEALDDMASMVTEGNKLTELGIAVLLKSGYDNACLLDEVVPIFKRREFILYVDQALIDPTSRAELENALKVYKESAYTKSFDNTMEDVANDLKKKLSTGTVLNRSVTGNLDYPDGTTTGAQSESSSLGSKGTTGKSKKKQR